MVIAVRIKDIAVKCGVSEGTVDRALNNRGGISEKTKKLILDTAKNMNYVPNHAARCLAKGRTQTIGVVCADIKNPFFSSLIDEIENVASENGYFINLILTHNSVEKELSGLKYLAQRQVDGVIIFPIGKGREYEEKLKELNVPIVTIYNRLSADFVHVDVDGRQIMRNAVSLIYNKGYRNIIYFNAVGNCAINEYSLNERYEGYLEGMKEHKLEPISFKYYMKSEILDYVVNSKDKPAIICSFDRLAVRLLEDFKVHGISVPKQAGIMGFDNTELLDMVSPRLYSVDCQTRTTGSQAVKMLIKLINGEQAEDYVTDYSFADGESL